MDIQSQYQDQDLYFYKKLLIEDWVDDNYKLGELIYRTDDITHIVDLIFSFIERFEEPLLRVSGFYGQTLLFWDCDDGLKINTGQLIDLEANPESADFNECVPFAVISKTRDKFIETLNKEIDRDIKEFMDGNSNDLYDGHAEHLYFSCNKIFTVPRYQRDKACNFYPFDVQAKKVIAFVKSIFNEYKQESLIINFNDINEPGVDVLRVLISLEKMGYWEILQLSNKRRSFTENDNVFARIIITKKFQDEVLMAISNEQNIDINKIKTANVTDEIKVIKNIGLLTLFSDGSLKIKEKIITMRKQIKQLCILLMKVHPKGVTASRIESEIIDAGKKNKNNNAAKYISELRRIIKKELNENIVMQDDRGSYYFHF